MTKLKQSSRIDFKSVFLCLISKCPHDDYLAPESCGNPETSGKLFIHFPDYAAGGVSAQEWIFCFNYCIDIPSCGETAL